jgi:two-component system, NtrC family, response regulator AlgB
MAKLLVVDGGNRKIWKRLRIRLESQGHRIEQVIKGSLALKVLARDGFDVVSSDRRIAEANDFEILREIRRIEPDASIILTTEIDGLRRISKALPTGDCDYIDYITTLWPLEKIEQLVNQAIELHRTRFRAHVLRDAAEDSLFLESRNPVMRRLLENAQQAAASNGTILLTGESGTGKTLLAQQMHFWSPRCAKPFVILNCASLSPQSLEREVLGQAVRTAPTRAKRSWGPLEGAEGGTVFLEDVCELSATLQLALIRFVQDRTLETADGEKTVDVRIIVATSRDLPSEVAAHRFREDLFYSLNIISLRVPALRERSADILPLARRMLAAAAVRNHRSDLFISDEAAAAMTSYRWPGNVRELRNAMEAAAVLCEADTITMVHLPEAVSKHAPEATTPAPSRTSLDEIEREHIARVLADSRTLEEAAMTLGINISTLWRKRKRYKLDQFTGSKV